MDLWVTQDQTIVHIANVANKKVMIGQDRFEAGGPDLFADRYHHEAEGRGQRATHDTLKVDCIGR